MADGTTLRNDDDPYMLDIDKKELHDAIVELAGGQDEITEATGKLRAHLKTILKDTGWNKTGLAMIRKLSAMSPSTRADVLRTFIPMLDVMDAAKWKDERRDMLQDPTENVDE